MSGIRRVSSLGTQGVSTIVDGSVQTADIANNSITSAKLATDITVAGTLSANNINALTTSSSGHAIRVKAGSGDSSGIIQFTNNAATAQWSRITSDDGVLTLDATTSVINGRLSSPNQPGFLVYTGGYNHTGNWVDLGNLGGTAVVSYNVGSHWNSTNGLFTAPISGYYLFYAGGWANYNGAGNRYAISFSVNSTVGNDWVYISGANTSAIDSPLAMSPVIRYVQAGWYVRTTMFSSVAMQLGTSSHKFYYGGYLLG